MNGLLLHLIDLDNFKQVNDSYGHLVGDLYLKHIAQIFNNDAEPGDLIGRIGGDEFVLIVSCFPESDINKLINSRLDLLFNRFFEHEGTEIPITFSAGVSVYPKDASDVTKLLKYADEAMYKVKRAGKNGSSLFVKA